MYEHDLLAGHPASEEPSRALTPGDAHTYWVQSWADVAMAAPQAWHQQSPAVLSRDRACARKVLQSFNTWAFKREQPSDPQLLLARVTRAIERSEPLSFVLYWGKGPRCALAQPDVDCLGFLARFSDRIGTTHAPGAALNLIFTDTHARHNGYAATEVREYFDQVHVAARERGFSGCLLSELVQASGSRVEWRRGPGFNDADVSSTLPIIPHGGFSPIRLEGWL